MEKSPKITLILPVYNEAKSIRNIINKSFEAIGTKNEILVVNDGSTDNTIQEVKKTNARFVSHKTNKGKGVTLQTGIAEAKGEIIVVMDADGQDDPFDIPRLVKALEENDADFVNGSRFIGTLQKGAMTKLNRLGTFGVDFILNKILKINITDSQAGFRAFKAGKLRDLQLKSTWYDIETETVIKAHRKKFKIMEIPVVRDRREHGESGHKKLKFALRFFRLLFNIYCRKGY